MLGGRRREVHAADEDTDAVDIEDPEVPTLARSLGEEPRFPRPVRVGACREVIRHLQVHVLAAVAIEGDLDRGGDVELRMRHERIGEVVDGRTHWDIRTHRDTRGTSPHGSAYNDAPRSKVIHAPSGAPIVGSETEKRGAPSQPSGTVNEMRMASSAGSSVQPVWPWQTPNVPSPFATNGVVT